VVVALDGPDVQHPLVGTFVEDRVHPAAVNETFLARNEIDSVCGRGGDPRIRDEVERSVVGREQKIREAAEVQRWVIGRRFGPALEEC
jgi:hypothetical protein